MATKQAEFIRGIDDKWLKKQQLNLGIKLKTIAEETGLNYTYLSSLLNGKMPLSQVTKAMFYYYFKTKK